MHIYAFYNDFSANLVMALCSKCCISKTAALIYMCEDLITRSNCRQVTNTPLVTVGVISTPLIIVGVT